MMNQFEMPDYLTRQLPDIKCNLNEECLKSPYSTVQVLLDYTEDNIDTHNYKAVKKCFAAADELYTRGNNSIRNAVTNVFVYSLSRLFQNHVSERKFLLGLIPISLYTLYIQQQNGAGC